MRDLETVSKVIKAMPAEEGRDYALELLAEILTSEMDMDLRDRFNLTPRELDLFQCLKDAKGRTVSREHIMHSLYGLDDDPPGEKILDAFVWALRKKTAGFARIETKHGFGYRLTLED